MPLNDHDGLHANLTHLIIGCALNVHNELGPGFPESVYHRALCFELMDQGIAFQSEQCAEVFYSGRTCGEFRMDLVVDQKVVVELKAVDALCSQHLAQVLSYLKATGLKVGLLLNFGAKSLQIQRISL